MISQDSPRLASDAVAIAGPERVEKAARRFQDRLIHREALRAAASAASTPSIADSPA